MSTEATPQHVYASEQGASEVVYVASAEQQAAIGLQAEATVYRKEQFSQLMGRACFVHGLFHAEVTSMPKKDQFPVKVQAGMAQSVATGIMHNIASTQSSIEPKFAEQLQNEVIDYTVAAFGPDDGRTKFDRDQYMSMSSAAARILRLYDRIETDAKYAHLSPVAG